MNEIPNLDPDYKNATVRLNRYFSEEYESIEDLSKEELLWYLSTVLLWYSEINVEEENSV